MRPLGSGLGSTAYETSGGQVLRLSNVPDPVERAEQVRREARLLAAVAAWSPLAVPVIEWVDAGRGCLAYPKLPGVPLLRCPLGERLAVDPACDFGLIHRDLGPAALDAALAAYGSGHLRGREEFYARCSVFEDLAYGLATGDAA